MRRSPDNILAAAAGILLLLGAHAAFAQDATLPADVTIGEAAKPPAEPPPPAVATKPGASELPASIFFSPAELGRIRAALDSYERSKRLKLSDAENQAKDFLNQLTDGEFKKQDAKEEKIFVYPQFFLTSLVYHGPQDWVVIINNQRFASKAAQENAELKLLSVDSEKVSLQWKPRKLEKVEESWTRAGPVSGVEFDRLAGLVTFILRPNQTFSSYAMRVAEGKLIPYVIDLKPNEHKAAAAAEEPLPAAELNKADENVATDEIKNNVGVKALNKTYKRIGLEP